MKATAIEWTDSTWNPIRGCSRVSEGCRNCYAERVAARFSWGEEEAMVGGSSLEGRAGGPYEGLATMTKDGPRWTGEVRFVRKHLSDPVAWKKPRRIFVNSMSDLFHENVTDEQIDMIFAVMALAPQHTFQILTKRPERMRAYIGDGSYDGHRRVQVWNAKVHMAGKPVSPMDWPLPNVWLGVSVENQEAFRKRVPALLSTPAAVRWVSAEPLLGFVDLHDGLWRTTKDATGEYESAPLKTRLDWVVIGGESGPGARPFNIDWAAEMMADCQEADVPVFMKQFGAVPVTDNLNRWDLPYHLGVTYSDHEAAAASARVNLKDRKGGDIEEWPEDFRIREMPRQAVAA